MSKVVPIRKNARSTSKGPKSRFGPLVKAARENAELSQWDLARQLGFRSGQFVSNWERAISTPPIHQLDRLARLLKLPTERLYEALLRDTLDRVEEKLNKEYEQSLRRRSRR